MSTVPSATQSPQSDADQRKATQRIAGPIAIVLAIALWFVYAFDGLFRVPIIILLAVYGIHSIRIAADNRRRSSPTNGRGSRATSRARPDVINSVEQATKIAAHLDVNREH